MKKIILATVAAAAVLAIAGTAEARVYRGKHSQYSANYEVENTNLLDDILGTDNTNWGVSPRLKFKSRKAANNYYNQREEQYGFNHYESEYSGSIVALGHQLQRQGFRVSEHPSFGGVHHVHHGWAHYSGRAIDVNVGRGVYEARSSYAHRFDQLASDARSAGYTVLWRVAGHYNHMHIQR